MTVSFVCGSFCVLVGSFLLYSMTSNPEYLFHESHGSFGILCAFLLGLKQECAGATIPRLSQYFGGLRSGHLVSIALVAAILFGILGWGSDASTSLLGTYFAWVDIRFVRDGGDASETLAFVTFFPKIAHRFLIPVANSAARVGRIFGLRGGTIRTNGGAGGKVSKEETEGLVAERRRERALKALDAKLKEIEAFEDDPLDDWSALAEGDVESGGGEVSRNVDE
eukprot:g618.t1